MYMALGSQPDIAFSVTTLSRYNVQPLEIYATAAKTVLRYLKTTARFRIHHRRLPKPITIIRYTDSDWAGNLRTQKSVSRCVFGLRNINANNKLVISGLIHWQVKSQNVLTLSILEAEYITCLHATWESLWLRRMMKEVVGEMAVKTSDGPAPIGCNNQGAIKLITLGVIRQKSKHIDVKYHHIHDEQMKGTVKFQYVTSESVGIASHRSSMVQVSFVEACSCILSASMSQHSFSY